MIMKLVLTGLLMLFLTCKEKLASKDFSDNKNSASNEKIEVNKSITSDVKQQDIQKPVSKQKKAINFEDIYHYPYMLTTDKFLLINDQEKMDKVYSIIHKKIGGGRMAPIPTVTENDSYLVFKAELKNSNDVEVKEIFLSDETLYVVLKDYYNPQISESSRVAPNILVKLLEKVNTKKIIIDHQ